MDFITQSLCNIMAISVHWSSDCNMACTYCYIKKDKNCMASLNEKICQSLKDGSYVENIKKRFINHTNEITTMSLWGAEPTINGKYFESFSKEILDFFPNLSRWMFSTNARVGGEKIYNNFIIPLLQYSHTNNRHLILDLQFSLDGPAWINDTSRRQGATENTIQTIEYILKTFPQNPNLKLFIHLKPTLDTSYMEIMCNRGIESFDEYYTFFQNIHDKIIALIKDNPNIQANPLGIPTLVDPGDHSKEDGLILAKWISFLSQLDRNKYPAYKNNYLIYQPLRGIHTAVRDRRNPKLIAKEEFSCSAGKHEVTIDYLGNLYTCERLAKSLAYDTYQPIFNSNSNIYDKDVGQSWIKKMYANQTFHLNWQARRLLADPVIMFAAKMGEIDKKYLYDIEARSLLFYSTIGLMCHIGCEEDLTSNPFVFPLSYARLLGNGAIDELIKYDLYEEKNRE